MEDALQAKKPVYTISDFLVKRMILSPNNWKSYTPHTTLAWEPIKFESGKLNEVPDNLKGVYSFVVKPGLADHPSCSYLLYVGKVEDQDFRKRYKQYLQEKAAGEKARRVHIMRMLQKWDGFLWFYYAAIADVALIEKVEDALIAAYLPPANRRVPAEVNYALKAALDV